MIGSIGTSWGHYRGEWAEGDDKGWHCGIGPSFCRNGGTCSGQFARQYQWTIMRYLGGKHKLAKRFLPVVLKGRTPSQFYVEPFLGGCNVLPHVSGMRIASDIRSDLIALYRHLQDGWAPPGSLSEEEYQSIRRSPSLHHPALEAFAAYGCSFGGKRWGGYARSADRHNYANGTRNSLMRMARGIAGADFRSGSYDLLDIPRAQSSIAIHPTPGQPDTAGPLTMKSFGPGPSK